MAYFCLIANGQFHYYWVRARIQLCANPDEVNQSPQRINKINGEVSVDKDIPSKLVVKVNEVFGCVVNYNNHLHELDSKVWLEQSGF